jgi:lysyl-tRNA synthetase, class II
MDLTEQLITGLAQKVCGGTTVRYGDVDLDFSRFERLTMREAITRHWPSDAGVPPSAKRLVEAGAPRAAIEAYNEWARPNARETIVIEPRAPDGELIGALFDNIVSDHLIQPTFVYDFPTAISPLSKSRADDPSTAERFELFVCGSEIANGFSELNDPDEQEKRFREQIARGGDEAPKQLDEDYIRALAHGMPPTGGEGIGIDRLVMLLTNSHTIREVVLFPLLRPLGGSRAESVGDTK